MSLHTCPTCGHTPAAKRAKPIAVAHVDVDTLTDAGLRAYRTRTAPYADLQFMLSAGRMSAGLTADAVGLATHVDPSGAFTGITRAEFYRQYFRLSDRKRIERNAAEWPRIILARKAAAWADARQIDSCACDSTSQAA